MPCPYVRYLWWLDFLGLSRENIKEKIRLLFTIIYLWISDVAVQRTSDRLLFTIIHLWISDVAVVSMKFRVLISKFRVQNSERRAIYSNIRVLNLNIAP
ncbi:MAG: hypothetical protein V7K50_04295 [Nostoc sp.]|uniref:hypothetical protein n=1 Tax=Nostoc sp. TaxID=1180 RepID=UPI002FF86623